MRLLRTPLAGLTLWLLPLAPVAHAQEAVPAEEAAPTQEAFPAEEPLPARESVGAGRRGRPQLLADVGPPLGSLVEGRPALGLGFEYGHPLGGGFSGHVALRSQLAVPTGAPAPLWLTELAPGVRFFPLGTALDGFWLGARVWLLALGGSTGPSAPASVVARPLFVLSPGLGYVFNPSEHLALNLGLDVELASARPGGGARAVPHLALGYVF